MFIRVEHYTLNRKQCTTHPVETAHWTVDTIQCTPHAVKVKCSTLHTAMHTKDCTLYIVRRCTVLYKAHSNTL